MTHTTGPWELRANDMFLRVVHGEHKTTVSDGIISEANAHLIAAAPDLLAALEACGTRLWQDGYTVADPVTQMVVKAIAKARNTPALHVEVL